MTQLTPLSQSQCSRVLYSNPVCFLCTSPPQSARNVMTVSWLTATDNLGHFVCAINRSRHSAAHLGGASNSETEPIYFVLSVATARHAALLRRVGAWSGRHGDKLAHLQIDTVPIDSGFGVANCAAYLVCRVNTPLAPIAPIADPVCARAFGATNAHHLLLHCTAMRGFVVRDYWDGRRFCRQGDLPPHLSFLGSQLFATIEPLAEHEPQEDENNKNDNDNDNSAI
jgi:hypothetical protein